ncbi:asparagine synthetase B family protein [Oleisolibacter albus]|uniref:asparagine synthetase B family protein n=1 Tax=Oleisolibacter albus TaxID=2171757 RepID=UPI000DF1BA3A|nr:asparagine synthase-related protein [Oleisolibacter albus]
MSAIGGFWPGRDRPDLLAVVERMGGGLSAYGPDRKGQWRGDGIALVWRQLSVLPEDLYDRQPLVSADGRHVLVADARIDNGAELADELGWPPESAQPRVESRLILDAYRRWGVGCVARLLGDFAFALWDTQERRLLLARDATGTRPLFWARCGDGIAFASMPRGLFAVPEISRTIDDSQLAAYLALLMLEGPDTLYRDIKRVPNGHLLLADADGVRLHRYWNPDRGRELHLPRQQDYAEALRAEMTRAVRCRLRSSGPVASMLSAGLDSSSVTSIAASLLGTAGKRLLALTAVPRSGFPASAGAGRVVDESTLAARVAALHPNIDHMLVPSGTRSHLQTVDLFLQHTDLPVLNPCNAVWTSRLAQQARQGGARVLLSGAGGNFGVSYEGEKYLPQLFIRGRWLELARLLAGMHRDNRAALRGLWLALAPHLPPGLHRQLRRLAGRHAIGSTSQFSMLVPEFAAASGLERLYDQKGYRRFSDPPPADGWTVRKQCFQRIDPGPYVAADAALAGIDRRNPLLDRQLLEFCLSVPERHYIDGGRRAALLRDAMAGLLPPALLRRRCRGLQAADWYEGVVAARDELAEEVQRQARSGLAGRALDVARMQDLVDSLPAADTPTADLAAMGWNQSVLNDQYRAALLRGIGVGRFLRRVEGGNA